MFQKQVAIRPKGQKTCIHHHSQKLEFFCEVCDELICIKCIVTLHKGHPLNEIANITVEQKKAIQHFIEDTETNRIQEIQKNIKSISTKLKSNSEYFINMRVKITEQGEDWKHEIDSAKLKSNSEHFKNLRTKIWKHEIDIIVEETLIQCKQVENENSEMLKSYKLELENSLEKLSSLVQECRHSLECDDSIELCDKMEEMHLEVVLPLPPVLNFAYSIPRVFGNEIERRFGEVIAADEQEDKLDAQGTSASAQQDPPSHDDFAALPVEGDKDELPCQCVILPKRKILSKFKVAEKISALCVTSDGQAWSCHWASKTVKCHNKKGDVLQEISYNIWITDVSISPHTQNLWTCSDSNRSIMELVSGTPILRFRTNKRPRCLCVTADNHILVGMSKVVTKYTTDGETVLSTESFLTSKPIVVTPQRIAACAINGNIAVVDWDNSSDGGYGCSSVAVMNEDFQEILRYEGIQSSTGYFDPHDVVFDGFSNIIIADYGGHSIHILNSSGHFLQILHSDSQNTCALGISLDNLLWAVIGDDNMKIIQYSSM